MTEQTDDEARYRQLRPEARALLQDHDRVELADMLVTARNQLVVLREVARGYCPHCGRGDAAPTLADWEQQKQRAEHAETRLAHLQATSEAAGRLLTRTTDERDQLHAAIDRVRDLAAELGRAGWSQAAVGRRIRETLDEPAAAPHAPDTITNPD